MGKSMLPSDIRVENALAIIHCLQGRSGALRADIARLTGLSIPAVHRQIDEMIRLGLVEEFAAEHPVNHLGRPATSVRFVADNALLAGVDVGTHSTRVLVTDSTLEVLGEREVLTDDLGENLANALADLISSLRRECLPTKPLVAVGIGVAATADPLTGRFTHGPLRDRFNDIDLRTALEGHLQCYVEIQQDDHLSATAEGSHLGAFPSASSVVVLEIGEGIGCGFSLLGNTLSGAHGAFGRIAQWPVTTPLPGMPASRALLGSTLTGPGIVHLFHRLGGSESIQTSQALMALATSDPIADQVLAWARSEIGETLGRLAATFDPLALVLGGGLGRAFGKDAEYFQAQIGTRQFAISALGSRAVEMGALVKVRVQIDEWLRSQLVTSDVPAKRLRRHRSTKRKVG